MAASKKLRYGVFLEFLFNGILLAGFLLQSLLASCLLLYGSIPIPVGWVNQYARSHLPEGLELRADSISLYGNRVHFAELEVHASDTPHSLLQVNSLELVIGWSGLSFLPQLSEVGIYGGTLNMPSAHAPKGESSPLLERIALTLKPQESGWSVDRFAALHEDVRLWGSISLPLKEPAEAVDSQAWLDRFYAQAAALLEQKKRISGLATPTITFTGQPSDSRPLILSVNVTSPQFRHQNIQAEQIQLQGRLAWEGGQLSAVEAPTLSTSRIFAPTYQLEVSDATLQIPREQFTPSLRGEWPRFQLAASKLILSRYKIDAPILELEAREFPEVSFHGAASGLGGAFNLDGRIHARNRSGTVQAEGSVNLADWVPHAILERLPEIRFHAPPLYRLNIVFGDGFSLTEAAMDAQIDALQIEDLHFERISARGGYANGRYSIEKMHLRRGNQWIDLAFELDEQDRDYRISLIGSAVPDHYNTLLPSWWGAIFRDFDFSTTSFSHGDFIIYGNTRRKAADLFFGHAKAKNVFYRGVLLDEGSLIVRGRGPYTELRGLEAVSGDGWARGNIAFASRLDTIKGPVSVRLDLEAQLALEDASRLFRGEVASLIDAFETEALPRIDLEATLFNQKYPEYRGKNHFTLEADCPALLAYEGIPFERLRFQLFGRSSAFHLRDLRFDYADGRGSAMIDITTRQNSAPSLRYELELVDAEQNQALANLPPFGEIKQSLEPGEAPSPANQNDTAEAARVDLQLHGEGPLDDIWAHQGFGRFEINNERLATIQLLGPLSKLLQNTELNFTSFNLNAMHGDFSYENDRAHFDPLQIDGLRTQIRAPGTVNLRDQSIDMRVSVFLFGNAGNPDSRLRQIGDLIKRPLPNLLEFELSGTLQNQKFRSFYDPRNLIPNL